MRWLGEFLVTIAALFLLISQVFANADDRFTRPLARRKPPPPSGTHHYEGQETQVTQSRTSCGLKVPLKADWDAGIKVDFATWARTQFNAYLNAPSFKSFPGFLRNKFAPDALPSSQFCDGIGSCTLATCQSLDANMSLHDRQMAYYAFEKISNIAHFYEAVSRSTNDVLNYHGARAHELVTDFTSAPRLERAVLEREKAREIAIATTAALLLIGSSAASMLQGASLPSSFKTSEMSEAAQGLVTSLYIGSTGIARAIGLTTMDVRNNKELVDDLVKLLSSNWNEIHNKIDDQITQDLLSLMEGDLNAQKQDIIGLLISDDFIEQNTWLRAELKSRFEKYFFATHVNSVWGVDRVYIVDTNSEGSCESDNRGPWQYRVCLPERPNRSYWLYSLDRGEEDDHMHNDQTTVKGPTGYRRFLSENNARYYNITLKDIVRSSLFVHENHLEETIAQSTDFGGLAKHLKNGDEKLGKVPGAFTVPVCRNPGGESISSVWGKRGRNYPCMCGEFGWKGYSHQLDETEKFLDRTGFKYSEDWDDYCSDHNHCKYDKSVRWNFAPPEKGVLRNKKEHIMVHPFKKCKKSKKHKHKGHPEKDDIR